VFHGRERIDHLTAFEGQELSTHVSEMIRATIKHGVPADPLPDLPLFLDLDLEVLAVSPVPHGIMISNNIP
jgi:predicted metal-dependent HD superfamily phosphohydrolase